MPSTVDTLVPLYLNKSRKGTDVPLPISEKNTMAFIKPHRVTPSIRDEFTRELLTGNYTQQERLEPTGRYYTAEDLASGVGGVTDCVLRAIDQTGGAAPLIQPELEIGYYSHGNFDYYHYGKMAIAETAGLDNHVTTFDCDPSVPVHIAIWTRDECNAAVPHRVVREVPNEDSFSGELTSGGRDSSRSTILDEYFYNEDAEYEFNRQIFEEFDTPAAHGTATSRELKRHGDYIGFGNGEDCQYFYTKFFPLEPSALIDPVIYTILGEDDNRTDVQEWTVVDNFLSSAASDYHCVVDKDLGIIRFGGVLGGAAVTKEAVPASAVDYIEVLTTENLAHSGRVTIDDGTNSETITYTGKTETKLLGITRAGTPLALSAGATVTTVQTGAVPGLGYQIIALYCAKARVDYQPVSDRSDNASTRATRHVNEYTPYQLHNNESILCIDRCNPKLGSVTVKALDLGSIRTDAGEVCQGPVYMNQDTVTLEVCVKDSSGSPMANTEVEVYVSSGGGYLDYVTRVNGVTDTEGKFWTTYIPDPTQTFQAVYARAADSSHVTGNTVLDFTYPAGYKIEPEDLNLSHVYAVLKDDPVIGSVGRFHETPILQWNAHADAGTRVGTPLSLVDNAVLLDLSSTADDGLYFWDAPWLENTDSFKGGKLKIGYVASPYTGAAQPITYIEVGVVKVVKYSRMWSLALPDNSVRHHTYVVLIDKKLPSVANSVVETWIKRPGDVDWNAADMNGRMTALRALKNAANNPDPGYTPWEQGDTVTDMATGTWLHPSSPDHTSLYKPVVPEAHLGGNSFQFDGTLPLPDESDDKNVLGAYAIFGNTKTKIQASVKDPSCHAKYLLSNELCLINARSPRDIGTYLDGSYVPYGWRLLTSDFDAASTLDTATYLTFNDMNRVATSEGSAADFLAPMVSVVESGAIMYDSDSVYDSLPAGISFEIVAEP